MIINGIKVLSKEHLEQLIINFDADSRLALRLTYAQFTAPTQQQKDLVRYQKRAAAKDNILAEMAAGNMARVRSGVWTTSQLIALTEDAQLKAILDDVNTLSFEIAFMKVDAITNPIVTAEVKQDWKSKLQAHFYLT